MKLMICVVHDHYCEAMESELKDAGYRMTELSSTGGFLRKGNTTFLLGLQDEAVTELKEKMKNICLRVEEKKGTLKDGASRYTLFLIDARESMSLLTQLNIQ